MRTSLSVNRTAIHVEPDFSTPRRSHDERATVCGKPQGASREPQGPTSAGQIGMGLQFRPQSKCLLACTFRVSLRRRSGALGRFAGL